MGRALDLSGLPQSVIDAIEEIVRAYRQRNTSEPRVERAIGWANGDLPELPQSFFDDLPDDLLDLFDGKAAA